jgi:hypothetical protein
MATVQIDPESFGKLWGMKPNIKGIPKKFVPVINEFVDVCNKNNLIFESFNVEVGKSKDVWPHILLRFSP